MRLTAAQNSQIAAVYEQVAGDHTLPPQSRNRFANKAQWFRMLAQIAAAKEAAGARADKESRTNAQQERPVCVGFLAEVFSVRRGASPISNS
jgi:hypothetical protein